jgi:hypothetical protein
MLDLKELLIYHCIIIFLFFLVLGFYLKKYGLLRINKSGFWIYWSGIIFFLINPFLALITGNLEVYEYNLNFFGEGYLNRIIWILVNIIVGYVVFFYFYIKQQKKYYFEKDMDFINFHFKLKIRQIIIIIIFVFFSLFSIIKYRLHPEIYIYGIEWSKIIAGPSGYLISAHLILYFLIIYLYNCDKIFKFIGRAFLIIYIVLRLQDPFDRASIVSIFLALLIIYYLNMKNKGNMRIHKKIKLAFLSILSFFIIFILVFRGHEEISATKYRLGLLNEELKNNLNIFINADTSMLAYFYSWSKAYDMEGYEFGIPTLNKIIFGWLPRKYFPWKDEPTRILLGRDELKYDYKYFKIFYGPKASILASFYSYGAFIGVIIGMIIFSCFCRLVDVLIYNKDVAIRAFGLAIMSELWLILGSNDYWGLQRVIFFLIPCLFLMCRPFSLYPLNKKINRLEIKRKYQCMKKEWGAYGLF